MIKSTLLYSSNSHSSNRQGAKNVIKTISFSPILFLFLSIFSIKILLQLLISAQNLVSSEFERRDAKLTAEA